MSQRRTTPIWSRTRGWRNSSDDRRRGLHQDRDGRYLLFNSAGARLVGKPLTECLGQDDRALFPADMALKLMETNRQVIANGHLLNREDTFDIGGDRRILQSTQWPIGTPTIASSA